MTNIKQRNNIFRRLTAGLLAICIVLSLTGVNLFIESVLDLFSVKAIALSSQADLAATMDDVKLNNHIVFTDEMDAKSSTILFNHWHLQVKGDTLSAVATPDEYRFYPYDDEHVYLFAQANNKTGLTFPGNVDRVPVADRPNEFELVRIFKIDPNADDPYKDVKFVISPQLTNEISDADKENGIKAAKEKFSNFSISSGHDSAEAYLYSTSGDFKALETADVFGVVPDSEIIKSFPEGVPSNYARMVVSYHPESINHIIKGHAFYINDIVTMKGADFANSVNFDPPRDAPQNFIAVNPYYDETLKKIVYTGEIDTWAYKYKDAQGRAKEVVYYNTSAGLHTNKTATITKDDTTGRLFDVNLETWYAGGDIADVGFILDASGSMAWTTDILRPLEITDEMIKALKDYDDTIQDESKKLFDGDDLKPGVVLSAEQLNKILNPANTDNTRLSYSEYNYYVYERRPDVDEFVPLAYWNGKLPDKSIETLGLDIIGYYPFDNNLNNAISKNGGAAMLVTTDTFTDLKEKPAPSYGDNGVALNKTASNGAIWLDVQPTQYPFSVSFDLKVDKINLDDNSKKCDETPIMYIGDEEGTSFYRIVRGNKRTDGKSANALTGLRLYANDTQQPYTDSNNGNADNGTKAILVDKFFSNTYTDQTYTCTFVFTEDGISFTTNLTASDNDPTGAGSYKVSNNDVLTTTFVDDAASIDKGKLLREDYQIDLSKGIQLIIGGNNCTGKTNYTDVHISNVQVSENGELIGSYALNGSLNNAVTGAQATYIDQYNDGFVLQEKAEISKSAKFTDNGMKNQALDITETAKVGGVMLDAVPKDSKNFTISFAISKGGGANNNGTTNGTAIGNIMYIGDKDISAGDYYLIHRRNSGYIELYDKNEISGPGGDIKDDYHLYFQGAFPQSDQWHYITYTVEDIGNNKVKITPYVDGLPEDGGFPNNASKGQIYVPDSMNGIEADKDDLAIVLAGLWDQTYADEYQGVYLYLDELCVIDGALGADQVKSLYDTITGELLFEYNGSKYSYAVDNNGNTIGVISESLYDQAIDPNVSVEGWYYVNSHSLWDLLQNDQIGTGKQLFGLQKKKEGGAGNALDSTVNEFYKLRNGTPYLEVNTPNAYAPSANPAPDPADYINDSYPDGAQNPEYQKAKAEHDELIAFLNDFANHSSDNTQNPELKLPSNQDAEKTADFFLIKDANTGKYYLRCYYGSNNKSEYGNARTQCSYVYYKPDTKRIKSESLQYVLASFTSNLLDQSPRSRIAATRFSISPKAVNFDLGKGTEEGVKENEKMLVMLDWNKTNDDGIISARRGKYNKGDNTAGADESKPSMSNENSKSDSRYDPLQPINQHNYFLTGGTYTWTGLKSFYDQLVKDNGAEDKYRDDRYYEGTEVFRSEVDKYVILFTDGRDNTVSPASPAPSSAEDIEHIKVDSSGQNSSGDLDYKKTEASLSTAPAKFWADKLKDEGYTVFVVMLASGSVSPTFNPSEYYTALNYLSYLVAGPANEDLDKNENGTIEDGELKSHYVEGDPSNEDNYVFVASGDQQLMEMFDTILDRIDSKLEKYTVQDFLDPRFDLVEERTETDAAGTETTYDTTIKLGAYGEIYAYDGSPLRIYVNDGAGTLWKKDEKGEPVEWVRGKDSIDKLVDIKPGKDKIYGYNTNYDKEYGEWYIDREFSSFILSDEYYYLYTALDGKKARLYYHLETKDIYNNDDSVRANYRPQHVNGEDMYYLRWTGVDIPGCAEGAPVVEVWNSPIRLRAKDDFIGGNSILTNGNLAYMNYVYTDGSQKKFKGSEELIYGKNSSGTDKANPKLELDADNRPTYLPSKGFPRVVVDVRLLPITTNDLSNVLYMGEAISPAQLLLDIEDQYVTDSYYLEYLKRYAYQRYEHFREQRSQYEGLINTGVYDIYDGYEKQIDQRTDDLKEEKKNNKNLSKQIDRINAMIAEKEEAEEDTEELRRQLSGLVAALTESNEAIEYYENAIDALKQRIADLKQNNPGLEDLIKLVKQMNLPLIDLLNEWLHIKSNETPKSFSIPYIYLSSVSYDDEGYILIDDVSKTRAKDSPLELIQHTNSAGGIGTNQRDVVGIITYRWEELDPETKKRDESKDPTLDYVKGDTDRVMYSLTVEYTPLYDYDQVEFHGEYEAVDFGTKIEQTSGEKYMISNEKDANGVLTDKCYFADFLGIDDDYIIADDKDELLDYFSRLASNNGTLPRTKVNTPDNRRIDGLIIETQKTVDEINKFNTDHTDSTSITVMQLNHNVYRWDKNYKPAPGDQRQIEYAKSSTGEPLTEKGEIATKRSQECATKHELKGIYGSGAIINLGRTLTARSLYVKDAVSGGIALELKVPVKDLRNELAVKPENGDLPKGQEVGGYYETFTLSATREFTDTDYIEEKKEDKELSDYINDEDTKFILTFEFNYSRDQINKIIKNADNEYLPDDEYVSIFARTKENGIECWWYDKDKDEPYNKTRFSIDELPIGTYTFELDDVEFGDESKKNKFNSKLFTYIGADNTEEAFTQELPYTNHYGDKFDAALLFDQNVLAGLATNHDDQDRENTVLNKDKHKDDSGYIFFDPNFETMLNPEINKYNIMNFRANNEKAKQESTLGELSYKSASVTFYLGTAKDGTNKRGSLTGAGTYPDSYPNSYPADYYINHRLGIIVLSMGDDQLTIGKTVDNSKKQENFDELWTFNVKLKSKGTFTSAQFSVKYVDLDDVDSQGNRYFDENGAPVKTDSMGNIIGVDGSEYDFFEPLTYDSLTGQSESDEAEKLLREKNYPDTVSFKLLTNADDPDIDAITGMDQDGYFVYVIDKSIKLKHHQRITIMGLGEYSSNESIRFIVTEEKNENYNKDDYSTEFIVGTNSKGTPNAEGIIGPGTVVECHNRFVNVLLPSSGGIGTRRFIFVGCCLFISAAAVLFYLYFMDSKSKQKRKRAR